MPALLRQLRTTDRLGLGGAARSGGLRAASSRARRRPTAWSKSICPYCAVGCGQRVYVKDEQVVQIEGDPDSPISRGRLCPQGLGLAPAARHPRARDEGPVPPRRTARTWEELDLDTAMDMIADRVIATRDAHVGGRRRGGHRRTDARLRPPRRRDARQRGELPHQEVLLGAGRGADREPGPHMTLQHGPRSGDLVRARRRHHVPAGPRQPDCIVIMGSNMAEYHPVGFQWVMEAKQRGAKVIHVDPRFTRTSASPTCTCRSARARHRLPRRADHPLHPRGRPRFREYVVAYTNAATIVSEDFRDTEDLDGLFSGCDPETAHLRPASLALRGHSRHRGRGGAARGGASRAGRPRRARRRASRRASRRERDPTLEHPRCVFQVLERHFARYTPEMVEETCGIPREQFLEVCEALCANSGRERTTAFVYAVGWTQHTVGVQYIRAASILQLLLGNIGRPGGGSWRCAGTRRSRARPTSRRSTTSCPATCRCRTPARTERWTTTSSTTRRRPASGATCGAYMRLAAEGVVGRRGDGRQRVLLRPPAAHDRRPLDLPDDRWACATGRSRASS